jgi:hypothetical protein
VISSQQLVAQQLGRSQPARGSPGNLNAPPAEAIQHLLTAFQQGLAEAGWQEPRHRIPLYFKPESISEAARDLVRLNVDVIFAAGPELVTAARNATTSIPIVAVDLETDPLRKDMSKASRAPAAI